MSCSECAKKAAARRAAFLRGAKNSTPPAKRIDASEYAKQIKPKRR